MNRAGQRQERATGLVRSLVVASATLAILLVCFSIYQYSQLGDTGGGSFLGEPVAAGTISGQKRLPDPSTSTPKVSVGGQGSVGSAHRLNLSFYPSGGVRSRIEIWVDDWMPVDGTNNEFKLVKPEVRLRTDDGNAIRVTAREGTLEAPRGGGGRLDPQRGRLSGDVLIEIDRLTDKERAALPAEQGEAIDPDDMVLIELDEIEFDLEYAKIRVPGRFHVTSRDLELEASDLIVRFNQAQSRVEYMRITRGGRLELSEQGKGLGLSLPGADQQGGGRWSLVEWMRTTIQARIDAQQASQDPPQKPAPQPEPPPDGDSVPVFSMTEDETDAPDAPTQYFARFEEDIDARQFLGDVKQSHLQADALEILRSLTDEDQATMLSATTPGDAPAGGAAPPKPKERIVLTWTGRLVVEALSSDDARWDEELRTRLSATGSPVRISYTEGDATCDRLVFEPDGSKVWLFGSELDPVVARSSDKGTMTGIALFSSRVQDRMRVQATGPGVLLRDAIPVGGSTTDGISGRQPDELDRPGGSAIEFDDRLEVDGHFVTRTTIDFVGGVSSHEYRVLDRAVFTGSVSMVEDGTRVDADSLTLTFGPKPGGRPHQQVVQRVLGNGHVVMVRGDDRLSCREFDMVLTTDREGKTVPLAATARGDVVAGQGTRTVRARDKLIVAFETFRRPARPFDAVKAHAEAVAAGLDAAKIDWEQRRREHDAKGRTEVGIRSLTAIGEASVVDPQQALEVVAEQLDCTVAQDGTIDTAVVTGLEDRPAFVRQDTFTVSGHEIHLNVPDQSAEVPGAGRLTFQSQRDLDGRRSKEPIPISIEWSEWMKYTGRENRAVFSGSVHATSKNAITFDCGQLTLGFEDAQPPATDATATQDWWIIQPLVDKLAAGGRSGPQGGMLAHPGAQRFSKEPVYILATGNALAETAEFDSQTGKLKSRSRIRGPKLSVDLRPEVSKMRIEGPGYLQLEDFREKPKEPPNGRAVGAPAAGSPLPSEGLFGLDEDGGPSATLITWRDSMWYDFSIDQTRFEGEVELKHFSGEELARLSGPMGGGSSDASTGRRTFLNCDVLTADFLERDRQFRSHPSRRMGGLSTERLRQFQASGSVRLNDRKMSLTADDVLYERERNFLEVHGTKERKAVVWIREPGEQPQVYSYTFLRIDLTSGSAQIHEGGFRGQ